MEELLKDLYKTEHKRCHTLMTVTYILIVLVCILSMLCLFLMYEISTYEQVEITTETYEQSIEGDDGNIVNGNQYNDNATHEGVNYDESDTEKD